jgi:hypothetical protein
MLTFGYRFISAAKSCCSANAHSSPAGDHLFATDTQAVKQSAPLWTYFFSVPAIFLTYTDRRASCTLELGRVSPRVL